MLGHVEKVLQQGLDDPVAAGEAVPVGRTLPGQGSLLIRSAEPPTSSRPVPSFMGLLVGRFSDTERPHPREGLSPRGRGRVDNPSPYGSQQEQGKTASTQSSGQGGDSKQKRGAGLQVNFLL